MEPKDWHDPGSPEGNAADGYRAEAERWRAIAGELAELLEEVSGEWPEDFRAYDNVVAGKLHRYREALEKEESGGE